MLSYFQHFRRSYFHKMIAFSRLMFALMYHSYAVQMLENVTEYFLSFKNDGCMLQKSRVSASWTLNGIATLAIGVENGKLINTFWYLASLELLQHCPCINYLG